MCDTRMTLHTLPQIAATYGLNPRVVREHASRLFQKVGAAYVLTNAQVAELVAVIAAARPGRPRRSVD